MAFTISVSLLAQDTDFVVPDSLKGMRYEELEQKFDSSVIEREIAELYARTYLLKAKAEKDTVKILKGFNLLSHVFMYEKTAIEFADSIIALSRGKLIYEKQLAEGFLLKGIAQYYLGRLGEALDSYIKANEIFVKKNNTIDIIKVKHGIGALKSELNDNIEALKIFKENYEFLKIDSIKSKNKNKYLITLNAIADSYNRMQMGDSAKFYSIKGLNECDENNPIFNSLLISYGIASFHAKEYNTAINILLDSEKLIKTQKLTLCDVYLIIGKAYKKSGNQTASIRYLNKVDSISKIYPDAYYQALEANWLLYNIYEKTNTSKDLRLYTLDRIINLNSTYRINRKDLNKKILQEYDIPNLIKEKNVLLNTSILSKKKLKKWIVIILFISIISIALALYYYRRQRIYIARYKQFVEAQSSIIEISKSIPKKIDGVSKKNVEMIINKLNVFENDLGFLDNSITLNSLAQKINTNTSYLSNVINFYKEKSFSSYINELRIDYFIEVLPHNTTYLNYTIKALADEFGFNNAETFGKYFYAKTGFYPSFYIKQQKNKNYITS